MTSFREDRIPLVSASPFLPGRNPMSYLLDGASLAAQTVKNLYAIQETAVQSLGQEDSLEKGMQPTPVFLPGEFHGQRSLMGYSP